MRTSPEKKTAAPTVIGSSGKEVGLSLETMMTYAESLGISYLVRRYAISRELAATVAELAGIGGRS